MTTTRHIALIAALTLACLASGPAALGNPFDFWKEERAMKRAFDKWLEEDPAARREYQDVERLNYYNGVSEGNPREAVGNSRNPTYVEWRDPRETTVARIVKKSPSRVPPRVLKYYRPDLAKLMPQDGKFQIAPRVVRANYYQPKAPPTMGTAPAATPAPRQGFLRSFIGKLRGK